MEKEMKGWYRILNYKAHYHKDNVYSLCGKLNNIGEKDFVSFEQPKDACKSCKRLLLYKEWINS